MQPDDKEPECDIIHSYFSFVHSQKEVNSSYTISTIDKFSQIKEPDGTAFCS
jgi:hypothetical protein